MDATTAPARLRAKPSWLINQAAAPANRLVAAVMSESGMRKPHYAVLSALAEFGPASQADLGRRCGIDRSDMAALTTQLTQRKLVRRAPDPADRRRNVITITAAGSRQLVVLDEDLAAAQDELLAALTPAQRSTLVRLLTLVIDSHTATATAADQGPDQDQGRIGLRG